MEMSLGTLSKGQKPIQYQQNNNRLMLFCSLSRLLPTRQFQMISYQQFSREEIPVQSSKMTIELNSCQANSIVRCPHFEQVFVLCTDVKMNISLYDIITVFSHFSCISMTFASTFSPAYSLIIYLKKCLRLIMYTF